MTEFDPRRSKSFDFAQDLTKQLITLATGVIALTITFRKDIVAEHGHGWTWLLAIAWIAFIVSIIAGIGVLMTLTGNLERRDDPSIYEENTRRMMKAQVLTFVLAIALTIAYGLSAL